AQINVLTLPSCEQIFSLRNFKFRERQVVARRVADHASYPACRAILINAGRRRNLNGRVQTDAWMIVVEDENSLVLRIHCAADACVARTQIAIFNVRRNALVLPSDCLAAPWAVLPVRRDNHPLFAQRMPSLFPCSLV